MFKDRLKALRENRGMTQAQLATELGLTDGAIGNYENGTREPKNNELWIKIAQYFNVTVDYLMDVDSPSPHIIAANTSSLNGNPIIVHSEVLDKLQQKKNSLAERIRNSNYTEEQIDKIEKMIDLMI